jgi:hypothetical protein
MGTECIACVIDGVKEALQSQGVKDFVKSFREDSTA